MATVNCRVLITFVNSSDPDQAWPYVGPDLGPNWLTLRNSFSKIFNYEKNQQHQKNFKNYPACKE